MEELEPDREFNTQSPAGAMPQTLISFSGSLPKA
jgi:hypothetical protein